MASWSSRVLHPANYFVAGPGKGWMYAWCFVKGPGSYLSRVKLRRALHAQVIRAGFSCMAIDRLPVQRQYSLLVAGHQVSRGVQLVPRDIQLQVVGKRGMRGISSLIGAPSAEHTRRTCGGAPVRQTAHSPGFSAHPGLWFFSTVQPRLSCRDNRSTGLS